MLKSIRIKNFKNFKDATLDLGPLTILIGSNASGKSNVRDAFRFLHGIGRGYTLAEILGEKYESGALQWAGIRGGIREIAYQQAVMTQIEVDLALPEFPHRMDKVSIQYKLDIEIKYKKSASYILREKLFPL